MLEAIALRVTLVAVGIGITVLIRNVATDLPGQLAGYGLGALFLVIAVFLVLADLSKLVDRRRTPADDPPPPAETPDPKGPPPPAEWAIAVVLNGYAALLVVAGAIDDRMSGDPSLLVVGGFGLLVLLGPTTGMLGRWWRHRG